MPFKYGDGRSGHFDDCVKFYQNKISKKTGKNYTKDEASAVCATIMRGQESNSKKAEKKVMHGKFTLSLHQLGNDKHFDLFLEKDGYCDDFAFTPVKAAQKNVLKSGDRAQKRNVVDLKMLDFTGVITVGKPGASKDFPGIVKVLERGTYNTLEEEGGTFKYNFSGKKLNGIFQFVFDTEKLQENYKYRYVFTQIDSKDQLITMLLEQIEDLAIPDRITETLSLKQPLSILKELLKEGKIIPLTIKGVALKEGIWNGLFYPYDEIKRAAQGLVGKPLMMDHGKGIRDIAGKVIGITENDESRSIGFEAQIIDENAARKVLEGLVDSVSVGVIVDRVKESMGLTARNYEFKELSILSVLNDPACSEAKIKEIIPPVSIEKTTSEKA